MATRVVKATAQSGALNGIATVSLKVPGTFAGIDGKLATFSGRMPQKLGFFWGTPQEGDTCTDLRIEDTDLLLQGVIGNPAAVALFPAYPIIKTIQDSGVAAGNQGFYIAQTSLFNVDIIAGNKIPSGFYIIGVFKRGSALGIDNMYVNIAWDDLT